MPDYDTLALEFTESVKAILGDAYPLLIAQAYGDATTLLGADVSFSLDNPFVQQTLGDLMTADYLGDLGTHLVERARALIGRQAAEGWSLDVLMQELRAASVADSADRAEQIARTETARAYSKGSILAWKAAGVVDRKQWLVTRPCPVCAALDGKIVAIDAEFAPGIQHPPDPHTNCKCAIAPVLADQEG